MDSAPRCRRPSGRGRLGRSRWCAGSLYIRGDNGRIQEILGDDISFSDPEEALEHVIPFLRAGLSLPAAKTVDQKSKRESDRTPRCANTQPATRVRKSSGAGRFAERL